MTFLLVLLPGQWLLLSNPGWFSHDELSWAARADVPVPRDLPWIAWSDLGSFQYRPLTFNLWLLLAHWLHDSPLLFHGLWVLLGIAIACLLRQTLRRCGVAASTASIAAVTFALNPYAAYVHGWVATLADLLWVGGGLLLAFWLSGTRVRTAPPWHVFAAGVATALVALSAKEAGIVLAPLAWLAWWLLRRPRHWLWAALGLSLPTLAYLVLRLDVVLYQPRADDAYAWSMATVPINWAAYHLYALMPAMAEVSASFGASAPRLLLAGALWLAVFATLWRADRRFTAGAVLGGAIALGPVLILETPYNQYAYGASAVVVALVALAWPRLHRLGRVAVLTVALVSTWHGVNMQRLIHRVGELQSRFTPSLREAVAANPGRIITVSVDRPGDAWIYARLSHDPLAYGSTRQRVRIVGHGGRGADYRAAYNGEVLAAGHDASDRSVP